MVRPEEMDGMAREARHLPQPQQQRGQQGSGRGAAILNAEVNGVGEMSFLRFVNRDRVRLDALGDAFFLVSAPQGDHLHILGGACLACLESLSRA